MQKEMVLLIHFINGYKKVGCSRSLRGQELNPGLLLGGSETQLMEPSFSASQVGLDLRVEPELESGTRGQGCACPRLCFIALPHTNIYFTN